MSAYLSVFIALSVCLAVELDTSRADRATLFPHE